MIQTSADPVESPSCRVLLVDDDRGLLVSLTRGLSLRGFKVRSCEGAGEAVPVLESDWPDIIVLDVAMPGMDGITFCHLIRDRYPLPILMLTARDAVEDRVTGLEAGADDYLVKPFALDELVARVHALLRRSAGRAPRSGVYTYEGLSLNPQTWEASRGGRDLELTATEFQILAALIERPGTVLTREVLLERVWGDPAGASSNVVDAHVANLRRKVEADGDTRVIQTVRRAGYRLQAG